MPDKRETLIEIHGDDALAENVGGLSKRIRQRIRELGISQADAARACGCSPARFGNYCAEGSNNRTPDIEMLARIAKGLRTSADWLLGLSEVAPVDARAVILRLLELDGMATERAEVIAQAAEEALRLLAASPSEGDDRARAHLAAQFAWQLRSTTKPT